MFVDVLPDPGRALGQLFTYSLPPELESAVRVGSQVLVPFGSRRVSGYVVAFRQITDLPEVKAVLSVLQAEPAFDPRALEVARGIARTYCCEFDQALRLFLPEARVGRPVRWVKLSGEPPRDLSPPGERAVALLREGGEEIPASRLQRELGPEFERVIRALRQAGAITERWSFRPAAGRPRSVPGVELAVGRVEAEEAAKARERRAPKAAAVLRTLAEVNEPVPAAALAAKAGTTTATVRKLIGEGLLRPRPVDQRRTPWAELEGHGDRPPALTAEQAAALTALRESLAPARFEVFLLHGVTGSGKTEVFLRAAEEVVAAGRQAMVLLPEIALTAQAMGLFRARFGSRVALLHSALSAGERYDEWQRLRRREAAVVVGARSAVFAPCPDLGLIVLDEEHEPSYKQENVPRYHAREVALRRAELAPCPVVLASATPSMESFYQARSGAYRLLSLSRRVDGRQLPAVHVVDLRGADRAARMFSRELVEAMTDRLGRGEQVILFLNRRGFSTFLICPSCGYAYRCPRCQVALILHLSAKLLRCHHCNHREPAPTLCPRCQSPHLRLSGFGTQRVEEEVRRLFPDARTARLDRDAVTRRGLPAQIFRAFRARQIDLLIGTQMLAKGFDFPGVTLVGVISADTSLHQPDFRAAERTFQLLTQVSGRSGRGEVPGEVIVQTYLPDHPAVEAASRHAYEEFYEQEIAARGELSYPPFSRLANVVVAATTDAQSREVAAALGAVCRQATGSVEVLGPAPAPLAQLQGRFRWHLLLRGEGEAVVAAAAAAQSYVAPAAASVTVDVDPLSLA